MRTAHVASCTRLWINTYTMVVVNSDLMAGIILSVDLSMFTCTELLDTCRSVCGGVPVRLVQ